MNNFTLSAEIVQEPQLRYTSETQIPVTEMMVQFPGGRDTDPPSRLKVVAWRDLAQAVQEKYHTGDQVILEGRLTMSTVDRPEGFKEKQAAMTAYRVHRATLSPAPTPVSAPVTTSTASTATDTDADPSFDDIPF
ncbi:MAG: single-stranded DNA-binding protein [Cyanobacteria bacterium J06638_22]